uniref:Sad1 and UNC84 domain containing 1b n=1 Tax=Labrus bergylta TaxID=56723 RepID=A0A3Q3EJT4_9LABR
MDFSQLHTYTPPQCAPENTGYTYSLSSSYSTRALEFEKEHQIAAVYESPRMSRRSLRLQTSASHYDNGSLADYSQNHSSSSSSYTSTRRETRKKQQSSSGSLSLSLSQTQTATPRKTLAFSCDASLLTPIVDQSHLRQRTITTTSTSVDGHWGHASKSHTSLANGYICKDCSLHSHKTDSHSTQSSSLLTSSSQAAVASTDALFSSSTSSEYMCCLYVAAHSSYCGSMNVKGLMTEDASHLKLNGSLCKRTHTFFLSILVVLVLPWLTELILCVAFIYFVIASIVMSFIYTSFVFLFFLCLLSIILVHAGDDCKGKQHSETQTVLLTKSSRSQRLAGVLWSVLPGYCVVRVGKALGSGAGTVLQRLLSLFWMLLAAPVKAGRGLLCFLASGWYQLVSLMSLLNVFFLTRCLPKLWKLLLLLLPLLLLLGECERHRRNLFIELKQPEPILPPLAVSSLDLERLERVEQQLALLWGRVKKGDENQDTLKEQLHTQTDRESLGLWVSSLLEERLGVVRGELEQQNTNISHASRLAELELLLSTLAAKTEVYLSQQLPLLDVGVKQEDHDALFAEVHRLEVELGKIRKDLQGVLGCKGKCEQLDMLQETVSSQVRKELQALFFGSGSGEQHGEVPESLVLWLSQRYVNTPDLQASLTLGEAESQAKSIQVKLIVQNALRLYSQDRTGQVDYALESGGGSILSTRCSETYETKTALMSLFGLPLWYFSQSPRVVIQPDVYPGNCWAFKGSQGYLVIRLSLRILPTSFCVEHIPKALSPTGNITSAPQNFTVFGLDDEYQEEGKLLGQYTYQEDGESLQTFPVMEQNDKSFQIIEVRVLSNWGHPEYTCMYRFRVHGDPRPQ